MREDLRKENAGRVAKILEYIGGENSKIEIEEDWELQIYYSDQSDESITIEMCAHSDYNGDSLFDPLMRIELSLEAEKKIKEAKVLYYLSRTLFGDIEYYSTGNPDCYSEKLYEEEEGELDERLESWLHTIDGRGYLTKGKVSRI